jgi:DNA polymerase III alpha subunit
VDEWGRTIIDPASVGELLMTGADISRIFVEPSDEIAAYNEWCRHFDKRHAALTMPPPIDHSPEEEHAQRAATWFVPDEFKAIDVRHYLLDKCKTVVEVERVNMEMDLFEERQLIPLLQLMIYLIDHFRKNKIVWGVGRGSSVTSFCLFLIGVHKVNPITFNLDVHDFLK